jgi:hypothetical protein
VVTYVLYIIFNYCAISFTKLVSAIAFTVNDVMQTLIIWIGGIIVTVINNNKSDEYNWESVYYKSILMEISSFVIMIIGNLIFNGNIQIFKDDF